MKPCIIIDNAWFHLLKGARKYRLFIHLFI